MNRRRAASLLAIPLLAGAMASGTARAQQLDLSQGGPVTVTARDGIDWHQNEREVIAHGNARAVRGNVTVDADRLIAFYRKKADAPGTPPAAPKPADGAAGPAATPAADPDAGGTEIYRLDAVGNVLIHTDTDQVQGDHAVYDMDQAVLVLTGHDLKLTTPNEVLTARDVLEYWPQKHMAVARGNAVVVTKDARRMAADTLVAYTTDQDKPPAPAAGATQVAVKTPAAAPGAPPGADDPLGASGKLQKVEAFGHVSVRTVTDTVTGDRAVYVPDTGIARVLGNVRITRGENQLNGSEAEVNQKTGISRLLAGQDARVQGLVVPNDSTNQVAPGTPGAPTTGPASSGPAPAQSPGKAAHP